MPSQAECRRNASAGKPLSKPASTTVNSRAVRATSRRRSFWPTSRRQSLTVGWSVTRSVSACRCSGISATTATIFRRCAHWRPMPTAPSGWGPTWASSRATSCAASTRTPSSTTRCASTTPRFRAWRCATAIRRDCAPRWFSTGKACIPTIRARNSASSAQFTKSGCATATDDGMSGGGSRCSTLPTARRPKGMSWTTCWPTPTSASPARRPRWRAAPPTARQRSNGRSGMTFAPAFCGRRSATASRTKGGRPRWAANCACGWAGKGSNSRTTSTWARI